MPRTIIQIATMMCPLGIGNSANNAECRYHIDADKAPEGAVCPVHDLLLEKTTEPEDKITVTIMDEAEVDTLIKHGDALVSLAVANELDAAIAAKAVIESKTPVIPVRTPVPEEEKTAIREKIQADITKFQALEDK